MKKILLSLFALLAVFTSAFADNTTISWSANTDWTTTEDGVLSYTQGPYTISVVKNNGATAPTVNASANDLRAYAKNTITISTTGDAMTQLTFTVSKKGKYRQAEITASTGTVTVDKTKWIVTWTGSATEVKLTVGDQAVYGTEGETKAGQFCIDKVVVSTDGSTPTPEPTPTPVGDGTLANPYNAVAATNAAAALESGAKTEGDVYVKGIISNVKYTYSTQFGTATFSISEDGKAANSFLCYGVYYLDNKAYDNEEATNVKVGDEVIVCGKLMNYNGTYETSNKEAYLYSLNGITTGINNITVAPTAKQTIYSIDGRKLNKLVKGINIVNGKKVIK